ncbi:O-antigen ligase family protein [Lentzea flaviverrucosa]|uniref:O-antigen ligase n=1 Tax=Lentzea flaviverrucosa TaxID=200379 RepID=A0A1H9XT87_9PSEU|nr:O-antigen ligase family protein [Lentzea flaviverrucosa]RDI19210.1 O-antigen ligase [Lentzea flaviverrucosa]SES49388.1 O-antigen ligase [Lentzea flaviverrucosa]
MWLTVLLRVFACGTVALAPLEGYLLQVHGQSAKVVPALLIGVWLFSLYRQRRLPAPHPLHLVVALLAVVLLATSAAHVAEPFTLEYLVRWVPFLVIAVVLADVAAREVPVRALLAATVAGAVVAAAGGLLSVAGGSLRATGPLEDPNDLAFFLVAALPLLVAVGRPRVVPLLLGAVLVAGAAATFSRGGGIALACALVWLIARRALPVRAVVVTAAVAGVAALAFASAAQAELSRALQEKSHIAGTNADTRMLRWQAASRMLADNPVLGVGPGGFRQEYAAAGHNAEIDEQTPVAHNLFLEVAAELGVPGFALLIAFVAVGFVASERALRRVADRREAVAVQAALIAVLIASIFLSEQYYLPLWSLVALAVAIERRSQKESRCAFST